MGANDISLLSLMIFLGKHGFVFYMKNQKLSLPLKASRHVWRMRRERPLRPFELIVGVNTAQLHLMSFVKFMAFEKSSQLHIHHNRMVYQRGKIEPFRIWLKACW